MGTGSLEPSARSLHDFFFAKERGSDLSAGEHRLAKRQAGHAGAVGVAPPLFALILSCRSFRFDFACEALSSATHLIDRERQGERRGEQAFGRLLTFALTPALTS